VTFTNLPPPKGARPVADNSQLLWYLISHLSLQRASLTSGSVLAVAPAVRRSAISRWSRRASFLATTLVH
ncbi:MAG: hypothetical protein HQL49_07895, partial [Gammaproteobacteria bacterium]|nr:hypothetical protein [Gammaproteobacteria bacterium]